MEIPSDGRLCVGRTRSAGTSQGGRVATVQHWSQTRLQGWLCFVNALVLAKVMLFAEDLHVAEGFRDRALFYLIVLRSAVFSIILVCFDILEEVLVGMFHGKTFAQSIPMLGGGGLEGVLLVGVIIFVVLIPFFGYQEIARVMGKDELLSLMFTKKSYFRSDRTENESRIGPRQIAPKDGDHRVSWQLQTTKLHGAEARPTEHIIPLLGSN